MIFMERLYPNLILDALRNVRYPGNGRDIVDLDMIADDIRIDGSKVSFTIVFDKPTDPFMKSIVKAAEAALRTYISPRSGTDHSHGVATARTKAQPMLPGVKNIIGVSSGKGGVGKSTVAVNLAVALAQEGYRVGLLDADIFGYSSLPKMFGVEDEQVYMHEVDGRALIIPLEKYGVKLLSIGFLVDKDSASAVARRHGLQRSQATHRRSRLGRTRLFPHRHASGHERHTPDAGADTRHHRMRSSSALLRRWLSPTHARAYRCLPTIKSMCLYSDLWKTWHGSLPERHPDERYYIFGREGA